MSPMTSPRRSGSSTDALPRGRSGPAQAAGRQGPLEPDACQACREGRRPEIGESRFSASQELRSVSMYLLLAQPQGRQAARQAPSAGQRRSPPATRIAAAHRTAVDTLTTPRPVPTIWAGHVVGTQETTPLARQAPTIGSKVSPINSARLESNTPVITAPRAGPAPVVASTPLSVCP